MLLFWVYLQVAANVQTMSAAALKQAETILAPYKHDFIEEYKKIQDAVKQIG